MSISITNTIKLFVIEGDDWYCTQSEMLHTVSQFGCQILLSCNCQVRCEEVLKLLPFNKIKGFYSGINYFPNQDLSVFVIIFFLLFFS